MALVLISNDVPQITLLLIGGVVGDRYSKRFVILTSDCLACVATAMLSISAAMGKLLPVELLLGSFLLGIATAFLLPAYSAINPELVTPQDLAAANGLRNSGNSVARMIGPALGGLAYALGGAGLGFGLDAASFGVAIVTMWFARLPKIPATFEGTIFHDIADGWRLMWRQRWLRKLIAISLVANTFCLAPLLVLLPLVVRNAHLSASFLGIALGLQSAIAATSAIIVGKLGDKIMTAKGLYGMSAVMGVGACLIGVIPGQGLIILIGAALVGVGFSFSTIEDTLMQRRVSKDYLSRVYGLGTVAAYSLLPVGYALAGYLARLTGAGMVLVTGGGFLALASVLQIAVATRAASATTESPPSGGPGGALAPEEH
jgi:DHA3 family tetracycline resistance protein-like MFS transporter